MADLIERLNEQTEYLSRLSLDRGVQEAGIGANLASEAADEIQSLRAALAKSEEACKTAERERDEAEADERSATIRAEAAEASLSQALARIEELEKALRELVIRTENFWALIQGEYGVCLSYDEDHNVTGFFSALDDANDALCPATPIDGGKG